MKRCILYQRFHIVRYKVDHQDSGWIAKARLLNGSRRTNKTRIRHQHHCRHFAVKKQIIKILIKKCNIGISITYSGFYCKSLTLSFRGFDPQRCPSPRPVL